MNRQRADETPAEFCQRMGWSPGTRVTGGGLAGGGIEFEITTIGEECVLARALTRNGKPMTHSREQTWSFEFCDWEKVEDSDVKAR